MSLSLLLRWSWRDLRQRWLQVIAIAIIIAFGTGLFSGLRSMTIWRGLSNDASYQAVNAFDMRVSLGTGGFVERGELLSALDDSVPAGSVSTAEERLIVATQVAVATPDGKAIVPGRLIGMDVSDDGPHVNSTHPDVGRNLASSDAGENVVMLERNFAKFYDLPPEGEATLSGDLSVEYVGHALAPEYFFVITPEGGILAHANFAAVFTSIETAQNLSGVERGVNDLVLTLSPNADEDAVFDALESGFAPLGGTVTRRLDDPSIRAMVEDVESDSQFNLVLAIAIFGGAVFAAFNLTSRIMDSQRREVGIAMALGVPPRRVAIRPLLFGAQVALLGVAFGIPMGIGVAQALRAVLTDFVPLPVWRTPFQPGFFVGVAALGFLIPFAAAAIPVWRAVRVAPIDAIKTGHLAARSGGLAWALSRVRIPGGITRQIPFRNVARAPRRTMLTAFGIAAIIAVLFMVMGMLDSFLDTIDRGEAETAGASPDRVQINLDTFYPIGSPVVSAIAGSPSAADVETGMALNAIISGPDDSFGVFLNVVRLDSALWSPTITESVPDASGPGLVIAEKAANDLGVKLGDVVTLRHPVIGGQAGLALQDSQLPVIALHPHPMRGNVYLDADDSALVSDAGLANVLYARPAPGSDTGSLKEELFALPGVASVQRASATSDVFRDQMEQFTGILQFIQILIIALALLIAYNTASINMDERQRENATMFAYGLPARSVMGMAVVESAVLGVISTLIGLVIGYLMLLWVIAVLIPATIPDLGFYVVFKPATILTAMALGIFAVAIAPLLTIRRLRRMNVPSTLRVME